MIEINDHGTQRKVAADMRVLSNELEPAMLDSMAKSCDRLKKAIAESAASVLPKRGGLAGTVARTEMQVTKGPATVSITATSPYNLDKIDQGEVLHPVYGHKPNVKQEITPRFWSEPIEKSEKDFASDLEKSADDLIRKTTS